MCLFVFTLVRFGFFFKEKIMCVVCVLIFSIWLSIDHCLFCHCPLSAFFVHMHSVIYAWTGSYLCALRKYATQIFSQSDKHMCPYTTHTCIQGSPELVVLISGILFTGHKLTAAAWGGGGGGGGWAVAVTLTGSPKTPHNNETSIQMNKKGSTESVCVCVCVHDGEGSKLIAGRALILLPVNVTVVLVAVTWPACGYSDCFSWPPPPPPPLFFPFCVLPLLLQICVAPVWKLSSMITVAMHMHTHTVSATDVRTLADDSSGWCLWLVSPGSWSDWSAVEAGCGPGCREGSLWPQPAAWAGTRTSAWTTQGAGKGRLTVVTGRVDQAGSRNWS